MKKMVVLFLFAVFTVPLFCACAPTATVRKEPGMLNLTCSFPETKARKTGLAIAIVSPLTDNPDINTNHYQYASFYMLDFNSRFYTSYADQLKTGFANGLQELVSKKGFNLKGSYSSFDDLTYSDRKDAYLVIVPVMNVNIDKKMIQKNNNVLTGVYTEEGTIQIGGELRLDFIEPLTKEKILVQRINLSSFAIQKPYKFQVVQQGGFGSLMASNLEDTSDKAITDASNEFFKKSMEKIWEFVSTDELLGYRSQVQGLKNLKRY